VKRDGLDGLGQPEHRHQVDRRLAAVCPRRRSSAPAPVRASGNGGPVRRRWPSRQRYDERPCGRSKTCGFTPSKHHPLPEIRELPEAPRETWHHRAASSSPAPAWPQASSSCGPTSPSRRARLPLGRRARCRPPVVPQHGIERYTYR
jgi:hypothetical protein